MKKNMGQSDKLIRVVIAFIIGVLYLYNIISGIFGIVLMVLAIILLLTSFFEFCPIYKILGKNTRKNPEQ
ncbi:YgaP family membrane protein [Robertkochia solimangrovi]|uniref:YgaP family membrane protein n=1 Tax=Robertkochia solimangrovi TaxID=2213046 RepID=UPI0011816C3C|nr:DUF2892 domain-containing protein [Robertkochia solimangrovi]TRZ41685.1 DUF2892 domain-containing protein [Robertkochia solimangrovi]